MIDYHTEIIDKKDGWYGLKDEWPELLSASVFSSFFLTWEWLSAWVDTCISENRSLFVFVIREKGKIIGIAPFYIEQSKFGPFGQRKVGMLGSPDGGSDYLDVLALRGREKLVANAIYDLLLGDVKKLWDVLQLQDIPADSLFLLHFMNRMMAEGKYAEITPVSYCPVMKLPPDESELYAALSQRRRQKFKRDTRVLNQEKDVKHAVFSGNDVILKIDEFFSLYNSISAWSSSTPRALLECFINKFEGGKFCQIDLLSVDGNTIAGLFHFRFHNSLMLYLMAVDKNHNPQISLGNVIVGLCIKNAVVEGYSEYDFLKGEEDYKYHWATSGRANLGLSFWQKTPSGLGSGALRLSRHAGKLLLR